MIDRKFTQLNPPFTYKEVSNKYVKKRRIINA